MPRYLWPLLWFLLGTVVGALVVVVVGWLSLGGSSAGARDRAVSHTEIAAVARSIARPLALPDDVESAASEAQVLAGIAQAISDAEGVAASGGELGSICREYADALQSLSDVTLSAPGAGPMIRSGIELWQRSLDDDDRGALIALLGIGSEFSKIHEVNQRLSTAHARVVACRLRLAGLARKVAGPEATTNTVAARFVESGFGSSVASDTLFLENVTGGRLTNALVVVELLGSDGSVFVNCFFTEAWEPAETRLAICRSERPARETVAGVRRVRCRVLASERMSRLLEIQR